MDPQGPAPPPTPEGEISRIGEFEVRRRIGAGGMGEVFEAVDPTIGKSVAIKILRGELARDPQVAAHLLAEARAANSVRHRNLVDVYSYGKLPDGRPYLVMELLEGLSLDTLIAQQKQLEVEEGIAVLAEVLDALLAVHGAGLVHRDVKPGNVFVVTPEHGDPYTKLLDFGLTRKSDTKADEGPIVGTPQYMAPEQLRGESITAAADIYSVGALAYKAFAGKPPYVGLGFAEIAEMQKAGPPTPLATLNPKVPVRLGALVAQMMAPKPEDRPTTPKAFEELRAMLKHVRPPVQVVRAEIAAEPAAPGPGLLERIAALFGGQEGGRKRASVAKAAAAQAPLARAAPKRKKAAEVASIDLLSLEDLDVSERVSEPALPQEQVQELVERALERLSVEGRIPAFPAVALQVVHLADQGDSSANELVRLINQDPSLTAHVLRMANSAYAARGVEIISARDAVTRLGFREIAALAAAAATKAIFKADLGAVGEIISEVQRRIWMQALASALGASWLTMEVRGDSQKAFLGGMLHDIGKTMALRAFADLHAAGKLAEIDPRRGLVALLEATHVELGVRMAQEWKLPAHVERACAEHHQPKATVKEDRELHIIRVASGIVEMRLEPAWPFERMNEVQQSANELGLDRFRLRATSTQVREFAAKAQAMAKATG
ncbi:MAG: HDOD domain-containing protein [Deltaproteobacteria bacterium]|nr:HDOD domain-containing protein [Deltaproteobacteria bacterium]